MGKKYSLILSIIKGKASLLIGPGKKELLGNLDKSCGHN
jgi:hypothetical protein